MNTDEYSHTQLGWVVLLSVVGAIVAVLLIAFFTRELPVVAFVVLIFLVLALASFTTLTVRVDRNRLRISFGPGLVEKSFVLGEVASCRIVTNPWYYGWGVRIIPGGWLFNVSGFRAVEIQMKNGKMYRIGSDEPEKLESFVKERLAGT
jgi:hypothetical protein